MFHIFTTTVIGVSGAPAHTRILFETAAKLAAKEKGCAIKVVLLTPRSSNGYHGRLVVRGSHARLGKTEIEVYVDISGCPKTAQANIKRAIVKILDRLS